MRWRRAAVGDQIVHERAGNAPFLQFGSSLHKSHNVVCQFAVAHVRSGNAVIIVLCYWEVVSIPYNAKQAVKFASDVYGPKRFIELHPLTIGVELPGICDRRYRNREQTDETKHLAPPSRYSIEHLPLAPINHVWKAPGAPQVAASLARISQ